MKKLVFIIAVIIGLFLFTKNYSYAQTVSNPDGNAPNTTTIVNNCISGGGSAQTCANQGRDYLNSQGYQGTVICNNSQGGCIVVCDNNSLVNIYPPPSSSTSKPPSQPNNPPSNTNPPGGSSGARYIQSSYTTYTQSNYSSYSQSSYAPPPPASSPTPFPTPTPDFNEAMCKCDSMNVGQIMLGQPIQVEAFAKVEGQDTSKAVVQGMRFRIYEGNASQGRVNELSERGDQLVTVVSESPSLVRYRAEWSANPTFKVGTEYRIVATPDCAPRTAAIQRQVQTAVLAERDENVGLFGQIVNFFAGLFGRGNETGSETNNQNSNNIFSTQQSDETNERLRLETFIPAQMSKEACNIVKFKFDAIQ